jgi:iron complex transport system substrate-binding protein
MLALGGANGGCAPARAPIHGPARIVSLAPSVTETLFAIGAGAEVVGVSQYCAYPDAARKLPKVGTFITPNLEAIVALGPTLVIGLLTSGDLREIRAIEALGIPTLMVGDGSIGEIETSIARIGDRTGRGAEARRLIAGIHTRMNAVSERLRGIAAPPVLMVVGHQPMVAVGAGAYLDELIKLAHGANIADAAAQTWPRLGVEYIIATQPEVILDGQMGADPAAPDAFWAAYPSIPAVKNHRVRGFPEDPTFHPGPRIAATLEILARLIHPAQFQSAQLKPARDTRPAGAEPMP